MADSRLSCARIRAAAIELPAQARAGGYRHRCAAATAAAAAASAVPRIPSHRAAVAVTPIRSTPPRPGALSGRGAHSDRYRHREIYDKPSCVGYAPVAAYYLFII